jgi:hypothetical protein
LQRNPEFEQSCALLRRAVNQEVISVTMPAIAKWRGWGSDMLAKCMAHVTKKWQGLPAPSPWLGQQSTWQLPQTRRYQQSRFPPGAHPITIPDPTQNWMVELSRWPVPIGSIGVIKSFEQYVSQDQSVHSSSGNWGNPYPMATNIRWYFRLSPINDVGGGPWINTTGGGAVPQYLPGLPYDDLSYTDDIWFPAGSSSSANIHLPVPGGYYLRVVCIVDAPGTAVSLSARLSGSVQAEANKDAQYVLRTSW